MKRYVLWGLCLAGLTSTAAQAQTAIAIRGGTLGVGGELLVHPMKKIGLRFGGNYLTTTRNSSVEGIDYSIKPKLKNFSVIADVSPLGGPLHVSVGLFRNGNGGTMNAQLSGPITIGTQTYTPDQVGTLTADVRYKDYAPYLGLGFGGKGRIGIVFDAGLVLSDHPTVAMSTTTSLTGPEKDALDQAVQQEQAEIQAEIDSKDYLKYYPVISLGLRIRL